MSRHHDQGNGQLAFGETGEPASAIRRALRRGPRLRKTAPPPPARDTEPASRVRTLAEWHDMTPGEQLVAWAGLRAWVTWLHDRYELATEDRLPRCWPQHPGLIEELYALKAWREEIYTATQPSGQAARYWHSELRQVLHAAATVYAAGCRTGHRSAPSLAAPDPGLQKRWAGVPPSAGIPGIEVAAGRQARRADGGWITHPAMIVALDSGQARQPGPDLPDVVLCAGSWWVPASAGWIRVSDPGMRARLNARSPLTDRTTTGGADR